MTTQLKRRVDPDAGLMLGHRLRRWVNIETALGQRRVLEVNVDSSETIN